MNVSLILLGCLEGFGMEKEKEGGDCHCPVRSYIRRGISTRGLKWEGRQNRDLVLRRGTVSWDEVSGPSFQLIEVG